MKAIVTEAMSNPLCSADLKSAKPLAGFCGFNSHRLRSLPKKGAISPMEDHQILLQMQDANSKLFHITETLIASQLRLIGYALSPTSPKSLAEAALTVQSALYSLDEVGDQLQKIDVALRHH